MTLSKAQHEAWAEFRGVEAWAPFMASWMARGLLWPPFGDNGDGVTSRSRLWEIADARPNDLGRWVAEAPKGASPAKVIDHVLRRWKTIVARAEAEDEAAEVERLRRLADDRTESAAALTRIGAQA